MNSDMKRLFFALEVIAPWPPDLPRGRYLLDKERHLTLAFLGNTDFFQLETLLSTFPSLSLLTGLTGYFDACLALPARHPHVIAWHIEWTHKTLISQLQLFQSQLTNWLNQHGIHHADKNRPFLPHVTISRSPFVEKEWQQAFSPLPLMTGNLHLYESLGHSRYQSLWCYPIMAPFVEIEHTADLAFHIRGLSIQDLYWHAQTALAFKYPSLLAFFKNSQSFIPTNLDEVIMQLNEHIGEADAEIGCPFKAISFHDTVIEENTLLNWEMIVDV